MDPFTLWLGGSVVAPDAYSRAWDFLRSRDAEQRISKEVGAALGRFPRRAFLRWYRTDETWSALVAGGQMSFDQLVERLIAAADRVVFGRTLNRTTAEDLVRVVAAAFVSALDPSQAVAVADFRSSERDARLQGSIDSLATHITATANLEERLAAIPGPAQPSLEALGSAPEALWLLEIAEAATPRDALVDLVADVPQWLRAASGAVLVAAAELCRCYRVHAGAGQLFELASSRLPDRGYYTVRAAAEFDAAGESGRSRELVDLAKSLSASTTVQGIAAALAQDPERALTLLSEEDALSDSYCVFVRMWALRQVRPVQDVVAFLRVAVVRYPDFPGLMIELAWALLERAHDPTSPTRVADRDQALRLGIDARDLRRQWRIDGGDAVNVACQAAFALGAHDRVLQLGLQPPDGTATAMEAANSAVRLAVAQAAMLTNKDALAEIAVAHAPDGFHRAMIQADFLLGTSAELSSRQDAYDRAWAAAEDDDQRALYWMSASLAGVTLRGEDELRARTDDVPLIVDAQTQITAGVPAEAVRLLRRSRRSEITTRLLVGALVAAGDVDAAIEELKSAATRFNDPSHLVRAVQLLIESRSFEKAAELAANALHRVGRVLPEARRFLHEVLVEDAGVRSAWGDMAIRAQAWMDDLGPDRQNRWQLVLALRNSGENASAWRLINEPPVLVPESAFTARLWVFVAAHEAPSPQVAERIVELVAEYPDDTKLAETAVSVFFGRGDDVWGSLLPETVREFQDLLTKVAVPYGSDADAAIRVISGSPDEMLNELRPALEANARVLDEMASKVRQGYPYGLLATAAGRTYTACLIHRAAGCLPVGTMDDERRRRERDVARGAVGGAVVVDLSTLVVAAYVRRVWPDLRGQFSSVEIPGPARRDVIETVEEFERPVNGFLFFDRTSSAVRGSDADAEVQERLAEHAQWVRAESSGMPTTEAIDLGVLNPALDDSFLPWLSALALAKQKNVPLWCDDLGLRTLAADDGVRTFGTVALLEAMTETASIEGAVLVGALRLLREEYAVDLELDEEWIRLSAASVEWKAGPAAFYFARGESWASFETTLPLWAEMAQAAADSEPARVAGWVHAAALGVSSALDPARARAVISHLAARGVAFAGIDATALAACAARAREVGLAAGVGNPVPGMIRTLFDTLSAAVGPDVAARMLLSNELADEDRAVVVDMLFGASAPTAG